MNPADDTCPRCGGGFHCGVDDATPCACSTLKLEPALLAQLRQQYTGCLCLKCLAELASVRPAGVGSRSAG